MGWIEGNLFHLGKVIASILVENELTNLAKRKLLLRPDMGQIKDVNFLLLPKFFGFFWSHGLDFHGPLGVVTPLNGFEKILLRIVWRLGGRVFLCNELDTLH